MNARKNAIPDDMVRELQNLQSKASQTRKGTPDGHEYRQAGDLLAVLAKNAMDEYGVSVTKLSLQMGLSPHTMRSFLMRRDVIEAPPSHAKAFRKYGTKAKPKEECKRGHSYLEENARDKWGTCRKCSKGRAHKAGSSTRRRAA